jgi:hypothetical protein
MPDPDPKNDPDPDPKGETFTAPKDQAEFDRMVADRLRRERSKFADYDDLKTKASKFDEIDQANKTEIEKATEAEQRATTAELRALRLEVALDAAPEGMPMSQVRKLAKRLSGTTKDEIEADAAELFEDFTPSEGSDGKPPSRKPTERLRGGTEPEEGAELDTKAILEKIPRL